MHKLVSSVLQKDKPLTSADAEIKVLSKYQIRPLFKLSVQTKTRIFEIMANALSSVRELGLVYDDTKVDVQKNLNALNSQDYRNGGVLASFRFTLGLFDHPCTQPSETLKQFPNHVMG